MPGRSCMALTRLSPEFTHGAGVWITAPQLFAGVRAIWSQAHGKDSYATGRLAISRSALDRRSTRSRRRIASGPPRPELRRRSDRRRVGFGARPVGRKGDDPHAAGQTRIEQRVMPIDRLVLGRVGLEQLRRARQPPRLAELGEGQDAVG